MIINEQSDPFRCMKHHGGLECMAPQHGRDMLHGRALLQSMPWSRPFVCQNESRDCQVWCEINPPMEIQNREEKIMWIKGFKCHRVLGLISSTALQGSKAMHMYGICMGAHWFRARQHVWFLFKTMIFPNQLSYFLWLFSIIIWDSWGRILHASTLWVEDGPVVPTLCGFPSLHLWNSPRPAVVRHRALRIHVMGNCWRVGGCQNGVSIPIPKSLLWP